jgi:hypothetical protein
MDNWFMVIIMDKKEQANHQDFFVAIYEYLSEAASE